MPLSYHYFPCDERPVPRISSVGFAVDMAETRYGPKRRNMYLIHYVFAGRGFFNGTPVERGQGFLTTPGMLEHYYADRSDPWQYLWIILEDPAVEAYYPLYHAHPDTGVFSYRNVNVVDQAVQQLRSAPGGAVFSSAQLTELFLRLFNRCVWSAPDHDGSNEKLYVDYCVNFIQSGLHLPVSVELLCRKLGVSQSYLYRIFQKKLHCSPKQYLSRCRLLRAQKLLQETELSVSDIAAAVGYEDALSFSRFFSGKLHMSPTQYRRQR